MFEANLPHDVGAAVGSNPVIAEVENLKGLIGSEHIRRRFESFAKAPNSSRI